MRIALLANNTRVDNGWGRAGRDFVCAARARGITVDVFVEEGGGLEGERVLVPRAQGHSVYAAVGALRALVAFRGYDVIHAYDGYPYSIIGAFAALVTRTPLVVTLHGTYALDPFYGGRGAGLYRWALRRAVAVAAVSRYTLDAVRAHAEVPHGMVVQNGISRSWLDTPKSATALPGGVAEPYLLSVGMVKPQKGFTVSLRAFAEARKRLPNLSYVIVGNQGGRHFAEVVALTKELGVRDAVYFLQHLSDTELMALYDHAALFLLTPVRMGQYVEGFGIVYREAGARGLAVIGTLGCGAEDAITHDVTGLLVPQNDSIAVAEGIVSLLGDTARRSAMGEAGRRAAEAWTWDHVAEAYGRIYAEALNAKH